MNGHTPSRAHILSQGGSKLPSARSLGAVQETEPQHTPHLALTPPSVWPHQEPLSCGEERRHPLGRPLLNAAVSPRETPTWRLPAAPRDHEVTPPVTAPLRHEGRTSLATEAVQEGVRQRDQCGGHGNGPGAGCGSGRKDLDSGYILKDEPTEFDEFDVWVWEKLLW